VVQLDGRPVGSPNPGSPGPVFTALDEAMRADFASLELTDAVPYTPPL